MSPETLLHAARLSSGLSLDEIVRRTRLSPRFVRALDEGRFDQLPAGLYARAYVRMFAEAVSADADVVSEQLVPLLPDVEEPVRTIQAIAAQAQADGRTRSGSALLLLAASIDAVLLCAVSGVLLALVAAGAGVPVGALAGDGLSALALGLVACVTYFILFAGIDGRTLGRALCGLPRLRATGPLGARDILLRAGRIALEETSLLGTWRSASRRFPST
jgi:hypothetical protein